jgi:hypothetical protein
MKKSFCVIEFKSASFGTHAATWWQKLATDYSLLKYILILFLNLPQTKNASQQGQNSLVFSVKASQNSNLLHSASTLHH